MPVIIPSRIAIILMALGLPIALLLAAFMPSAWVFVFAGIAAVLSAVALDGILSVRARDLTIEPDIPAMLFVGSKLLFVYS